MLYNRRLDIPKKYRWSYNHLFKNLDEWDNSFSRASKEVNNYFKKINFRLVSFEKAINLFEKTDQELNSLYLYIKMKRDVHQDLNKFKKRSKSISRLIRKHKKTAAKIIKIYSPVNKEQTAFVKHYNVTSTQLKYSRKKHDYLSKYRKIERKLFDVEFKVNGEEFILNKQTYSVLNRNDNKKIRLRTYKLINDIYYKRRLEILELLKKSITKEKDLAQDQGHTTVLESYLAKEGIKKDQIKSLVKAHDLAIPIYKEYLITSKKKVFSNHLRIEDQYVQNREPARNIELDESLSIVKKALSILGEEYNQEVNSILKDRVIDFYPHLNKRSGAYVSTSYYNKNYILVNYNNSLKYVKTIAHEIGHLAKRNINNKIHNRYTSNYSSLVSETTSIINEVIIYNYLIDNAKNKEDERYYIKYFLDRFKTSFFKQMQIFKLQEFIYSQSPETLTHEEITSKYKKISDTQNSNQIKIPETGYNGWMRSSHIYKGFHTYKYAFGILIAIYVSKQLKENKITSNQYLCFIKSGNKTTIDAFKTLNIDLDELDDIFQYSVSYYEEMTIKYKKLIMIEQTKINEQSTEQKKSRSVDL